MIEALAHDLGKACSGRFAGNHAVLGAELMRAAGFHDGTVLQLVQRHHAEIDRTKKRDLFCLKLADHLAASCRCDGGASKTFTVAEMKHQHLKLTEAYLQFGLRRHFQKIKDDRRFHRISAMDEYEAFKLFVQNNWWLELVRASSTDASNESLRHHLLLTDDIYQRLLLSPTITIDVFSITIPEIEGRRRDIDLRLKLIEVLACKEELDPYGVWKALDERGIQRDKRFIARLLEEMLLVGILEKNNGDYNVKKGFAPTQLTNKTHRRERTPSTSPTPSPTPKARRNMIVEKLVEGFSINRIALEFGITQMEVEGVVATENE